MAGMVGFEPTRVLTLTALEAA